MDSSDDARRQQLAAIAKPGLSRRGFLSASAAVLGVGTLGGWLADSAAAAANGIGGSAAPAVPPGLTGTLADIKHVVVLVQENRSFDHYYGMVPGVRGFADKQALTFQNGLSVFHQPDPSRSDGGYLLPFRLVSGKVNALGQGSLPHGWATDGVPMWNKGAWNAWTTYKTPLTMGYFTEDDIPWHWALVNNWTICDHNHCSFNGSTDPNRFYVWSGTVDPNGVAGGPELSNPPSGNPTWASIYDLMQDAGVDWRAMAAAGSANDMGARSFARIHAAATSTDPAIRDEAVRGKLVDAPPLVLLPDPIDPKNIDIILADFIEACTKHTLPEVAFINSGNGWDEHPASTDRGMAFTYRVIQAMAANPDVWNSTLLITTYDENDGLFDHVLPPMAELGTKDEFVNGNPLGPGGRVPMMLISPWTRRAGGAVCSEVSDHTSITQFLEVWLQEARGKTIHNPNITDWRRTVCSDLLSGFDFANPDFSVPELPDATVLIAAVSADQKLPAAAPPPVGSQTMPVPAAEDPSNRRVRRPVRYAQNAVMAADDSTGAVTVTLTNDGDSGCSLLVYPDAYLPLRATPYTVVKGTARTHVWDTTTTGGQYAMTIYGPDRFIRSFAGSVRHAGMGIGAAPTASTTLVNGTTRLLRIQLGNVGLNTAVFTLTPNDYAGSAQTVAVAGGATSTVDWPTDPDGYYDVIVTDTSNSGFRHRYAGRINATA